VIKALVRLPPDQSLFAMLDRVRARPPQWRHACRLDRCDSLEHDGQPGNAAEPAGAAGMVNRMFAAGPAAAREVVPMLLSVIVEAHRVTGQRRRRGRRVAVTS
jgi:hypothetical protein